MPEGEDAMQKFSVYVQCYMDTYIILLADSGLHNHEQYAVLNDLVSWTDTACNLWLTDRFPLLLVIYPSKFGEV